MNLIRKGHGHAHRGVIGIESAIVLIAFVIVAAALAFVVLNMGFATTQKAKTSIISSLGEAGSSLEISGKVIGFAEVANDQINSTSVPLKITSGGESVDLDDSRVAVKFISNNAEQADILTAGCTLSGANNYNTTAQAFAAATPGCLSADPLAGGVPIDTRAVIYWTKDSNDNSILDAGEHAVLAIGFSAADKPGPLDTIRAEVILSAGATLTVERSIPNISTEIVDLG